jgi:hypothetical protein
MKNPQRLSDWQNGYGTGWSFALWILFSPDLLRVLGIHVRRYENQTAGAVVAVVTFAIYCYLSWNRPR